MPAKRRSKSSSSSLKTGLVESSDWMLNFTYIIVGLAIVLVFAQFALYGARYRSVFDDSTYQVVTLSNGQVLFGFLEQYGRNTFVLTDVYYLQTTVAETTPSVLSTSETGDGTEEGSSEIPVTASDAVTDESSIRLVPLVEDFHGPQNRVILNEDHIIYWQNLRLDSPVIDAIIEIKQGS